MDLKEKTLSNETIYKGRVINVTRDMVLLSSGRSAFREVVHHQGGVCVLAIKDNEILLVKQFRYPYKEVLYELPAGKLEIGEIPLETGKRELQEETGALTDVLYSLGMIYPTPGYSNEIIYLFYTESFVFTSANPDEDELVEVVKIPLDLALAWINEGIIVDAKTIIAIYKYMIKKALPIV